MQSSISDQISPTTTAHDISNGVDKTPTHLTVHNHLEVKKEESMLEIDRYSTNNGRTDTANEELQQLIQILEKDRSEGRMRQASGDEYPNGSSVHHSPGTTDMYGGYRNQPEIVDESSMLPYNVTGSMAMRARELSITTEETTSYLSSQNSPTQHVHDFDTATISALLDTSQKFNISDNAFDVNGDSYDESPRKMSRVSSSESSSVNVDKLYSADLNQPSAKGNFTFTTFGMEISPQHVSPADHNNSVFTGNNRIPEQQCSPHSQVSPVSMMPDYQEPRMPRHPVPLDILRKVSPKTPPLTQHFPDRHNNIMLKILKQPEAQHRARYMTEGSRGAVKDSQQQSHPAVQLLGWTEDARLEVFIGADSGKVKPHGFYQACRISGKNASASKEKQIEGTTVIEMEFDKTKNMTATIDCIGILKLRNTDVERRIGLVKNKKKKSTKCRLIYRVNLLQGDGSTITLQTASTVIACTQPAGQPEISRMSLDVSPMSGGQDLFVIGKNFNKGFKVKFQQVEESDDTVLWEQEAKVDQEFTQLTHFICAIPAYTGRSDSASITAQVVVTACGGSSEPVTFTYQAEQMKEMMPSPTDTQCPSTLASAATPQMMSSNTSPVSQPSMQTAVSSPNSTAMPAVPTQNSPQSIVAPQALELALQIQQQASNGPSRMFQIPDGVDFISQETSCSSQGDYKPISFGNNLINDRFLPGAANFQTTTTMTSSSNPLSNSNSFLPH